MPWNPFQPGMANDMPVDPKYLIGSSRAGGYSGYTPGQPVAPQLNPDGSYRMMPLGQPNPSGGTGLLAPMDASALGGGLQTSNAADFSHDTTQYYTDPSRINQSYHLTGPAPDYSSMGGYFNSLNPAQRDSRLAMLRQYNPTMPDSQLLWMDQGDYDWGRAPYSFSNFLHLAPSGVDAQNNAARHQQYEKGGFWGDAGKPLLATAAGMFATGGLSLASKLGDTAQGQLPTRTISDPNGIRTGGNMNFLPGGGGSAEQGQGGLFDSLLGGLGNLSPAILAGYLGNQQRQDVMGQVGKLNTLGDSLSGPAFMNSITNPYDLQTGQGRTALTQNLQQRGVGGSSFGNQQLGNYDYMRGLGRGDLATRAQAGIAGTQGQLYSDALRGMVGGNAAYNQLLGGGLGASGSLFNRSGGSGIGSTGNGLFDWLRNLGGGGGSPGVPGVPGDPNIDPNTGLPANYPGADGSIDPNTGFPDMGSTFDPSIDWSSLYG